MTLDIIIWGTIAVVSFILARKWPQIVHFFARRIPFLAGIPIVGSIFQSEEARKKITSDHETSLQAEKLALKEKARELRKSLPAAHFDRERKYYSFDTYSSLSKEDRDKDNLAKKVLKNSLSSHNKLSNQSAPSSIKKIHLNTLSYYSHKFQNDEDFREPFSIWYYDDISDGVQQSSIEYIVKRLRERTFAPTLLFLTGSIGSGKSTMAAIVQGTLQRDLTKVSEQVRDRIVPVDFENVLVFALASKDDISTDLLARFVFSEIKKNFSNIHEANLDEHLSRSARRYIFILDNLDLAYAEFCKHFVEGNQDVQGVIGSTKYLACLKHLVHVFQSVVQVTGQTTPSALFCLRHDTMFLLEQATEQIGEPTLKEQHNFFSLKRPEGRSAIEHFSAVAEKRGKLVSRLLADTGEQGLASSVDSWFSVFSNGGTGSFKRYVNLSVQGMRTAIHSLNKYVANSQAPSETVFRALLDPYKTEVLGYINGQEFYSQNQSNITNIFLVNSEYRNSSAKAVVPTGLSILPYFHEHTYWLKYLVFCFIAAQSNEGKGTAVFEEVRDLFSDKGQYPRDLVSLIVYSLTEIEHGRLVRPRSDDSDRLLTLTSRGAEFATDSANVAWTPSYLATIIEDEWLELPKSLNEKTEIFGTRALWNEESYCDYIVNKVEVVSELIICLELALKFEEQSRPALFKELRALEEFQPFWPDFQKARETTFEVFSSNAEGLSERCKERISSTISSLKDELSLHARTGALKSELFPLYDYKA